MELVLVCVCVASVSFLGGFWLKSKVEEPSSEGAESKIAWLSLKDKNGRPSFTARFALVDTCGKNELNTLLTHSALLGFKTEPTSLLSFDQSNSRKSLGFARVAYRQVRQQQNVTINLTSVPADGTINWLSFCSDTSVSETCSSKPLPNTVFLNLGEVGAKVEKDAVYFSAPVIVKDRKIGVLGKLPKTKNELEKLTKLLKSAGVKTPNTAAKDIYTMAMQSGSEPLAIQKGEVLIRLKSTPADVCNKQ